MLREWKTNKKNASVTNNAQKISENNAGITVRESIQIEKGDMMV